MSLCITRVFCVFFFFSLSLCVVPLWSLHLMEHKAKGRERLTIIPSYLPWGLMFQHDTQSLTVIRSVYTEMYLNSASSPPPPTQILNSKVSKKVLLPVGQTLSELYSVYPIIVPDRWHQIKWKSTHTYICSRRRRWRDMRSTSGQQLDGSNWRGFVSVAHSSPRGNTLSGLVCFRAAVQSVKCFKSS